MEKLIERYPELTDCASSIEQAFEMLVGCLENQGTIFICGNGGSAADSEHIAGELLKGFLKKRPLDDDAKARFAAQFGDTGAEMAAKLQGGLKAIALTSHPAFATAFLNDVDGALIYAQQLYALGKAGDVLLGITTSGNAGNIRKAMMAARVKGIATILLTGEKNGCCAELADCVIHAPSGETFIVQEYHLPIYHVLCAMVEDHFFSE